MKKTVVYTFAGLFVALTVVYLVLCIGIATERHNEQSCTGLNVYIMDSIHCGVTTSEIRKYMDKEYGKYINEPVSELDLTKIEKIINGKSTVRNSEAYVSSDGYLNIKISQRTPVVGFRSGQTEYYADAEGFVFPLSQSSVPGAVMISGKIPLTVEEGFKGELTDSAQRKWLMETIGMTQYIKKARLWKEVDYSVTENGDMTINPEGENVTFILGSPENYVTKLGRIKRYYLGVVPSVGEDYYSTVNVKYAGQLVCRQPGKVEQRHEAADTTSTTSKENT